MLYHQEKKHDSIKKPQRQHAYTLRTGTVKGKHIIFSQEMSCLTNGKTVSIQKFPFRFGKKKISFNLITTTSAALQCNTVTK